MAKPRSPSRKPESLRTRALARLPAEKAKSPLPTRLESQRMLHELEVHQIELELQNEELQLANTRAESAATRYRALYDDAPIGYATLERDGTIREANRACSALLGAPGRTLLGARFNAFVVETNRRAFSDFLLRASGRSEGSEDCEVTLERRREGSGPMIVQLTAAPRAVDSVLLLTIADVTARRLAEQELREVGQRKDEFLATLSHELRNPLAPILLNLEILEQAPTDERARAVIGRQVAHLSRLVDDLLDVARIASGKIRLQRAPVELTALVRDSLEDVRATFESRRIRLEQQVENDRIWIDADGARISQVLGNLLGNAEKFTPQGGSVRVSLRHRRADALAELRVRDSGIGIAPAMIESLFQPFTQAPQSLDRSRGGLGLGLAMVKELVEQHGGSVRATSAGLGHGAELVVLLPVIAARDDFVEEAESGTSARKKVLVIDDSTDVADSMRMLLTRLGHEVHVAYEGEAGVALARAIRPDLVLCDLGLPGMSGFDVARVLGSDPDLRATRVVALSGYAQQRDRERAIAAGFHEHVAKPISVARLSRLLSGE